MSLEDVYKKYSEGDRTCLLTILDFEKKGTNTFEFSWENIGTLSGFGKSELWAFENNELRLIEVTGVWMS